MLDNLASSEWPLPLGPREIKSLIPHRYPFLLVDRVIALEPGKSIKAYRLISFSDQTLEGHFPDDPVVPGVLLLEGLAQTAAILGRSTVTQSASIRLTRLGEARFRRPVVPGDKLDYEVKLTKSKGAFFWFECQAFVEGELACSVEISAKLF